MKYQQTRRRSPVLLAQDAAPSGNLAKAVVVAAEVLGSKTVEVPVTPSSVTRGTRAFRYAAHGHSPKELAGDSPTRLNDLTLPVVLPRETPKQ